ncbi:MAG: SDR family oxidoreductase [Pseudomonadota bacterium]
MARSGFEQQVVWITGASSGIGAALAEAFSRLGARVVLSARRVAELEKVRARCERPADHFVLPLDMASADFAQSVADVLARYGRIDVLINNAGISQRSRVAQTGLDVDRRIMEVNYFGVVALTRAVLPVMQRQGSGHIIVVSSLVGLISTPMRSTYAASKHALHGFFEALRAEEYDNGIRVLMVCPGSVRTEVSVHALAGDGSEHGVVDEMIGNGLDPAVCADRILAALKAGREQVLVSGPERLAVTLYKILPSLYRRLVRRAKVT